MRERKKKTILNFIKACW